VGGQKLAPESLRATCSLADLGCETTAGLSQLTGIIGQERAVKALHFGLGIMADGFNIFVAGAPGTGRTTAVKGFLEKLAKEQPVPMDWCYVYNFKDSYRPQALSLPPGIGTQVAKDMKAFINTVRREIPKAFESDEYIKRREEILQQFAWQKKELTTGFNQRAQAEGMMIQNTQIGVFIVPLGRDGQPLEEQAIMALSAADKQLLEEKREKIEKELSIVLKEIKNLEKKAVEAIENLDQEVAQFVLGHLFSDLLSKYEDFPAVITYLHEVRNDILENIDQFRQQEGDKTEGKQESGKALKVAKNISLRKYEVNVVVDNSNQSGAPVVIEPNPTYNNLFGRIEKEAQFGTLVTDFTMIRGGTLHQANGGYLVLPVEELVSAPFAWESLKRALKNKEISMEEPSERLGFMAAKSLRPEEIPLAVKVILIGRSDLYRLLYFYDEDFRELFKVKAEFDTTMPRNQANICRYADFLSTLSKKEGLLHLDVEATARVIEHSSRLAEHQGKLSTRFAEIADLVREAHYYASSENAAYIRAEHIQRGIEERVFRTNLLEEKINELTREGQILISTSGAVVGQGNGLAVINLGDISFGKPSRITASTGPGREGIIDIEREVKLGGPLHSKGVMILTGFIAARYGKEFPLSLTARLVFEQNYEGVDGDSASSIELYTLLSSLSQLPLKQSIAVTGSVNQLGEVQAIGGVNEKIEGFFTLCAQTGLTGEEGVLIPKSNIPHLMLKGEVVEAVRAGKFNVWAIETIDQGIEILTGVPAGEPDEAGNYPPGTVNYLVLQRLREFAEITREWEADEV
jgi:predicted ATP-dependent protease